MKDFKVKIKDLVFIKILAYPVNKSELTEKEEDAYIFHDREYIKEKFRGSLLDGHYEILEVK